MEDFDDKSGYGPQRVKNHLYMYIIRRTQKKERSRKRKKGVKNRKKKERRHS